MNKTLLSFIILFCGMMLFIASCKNNETTDPSYTATQEDLNKSTAVEETDVTGKKYGESVSIPHNGTPNPPESTYRDIYSNSASKSTADYATGTIFTKRTYAKNADGSKGELFVTFAMIKHEAGYYPDGGDFEYVMMPNTGENDYNANPNGELPPASETNMRGQLGNCAGCHSQTSSFIFARDGVPAFKATQADLDKSTMAEDLNVTGAKYGEAVSIAHNGTPDPNTTFRDIYSSIYPQENIDVGTILTKRTSMKNEDSSKGDLQVTFAMIKREPGYFPEGGDWEYVMMPNDGSNDYEMHPNGMLPDESSEMRGKNTNCAQCHSQAGSSFSFVRNSK